MTACRGDDSWLEPEPTTFDHVFVVHDIRVIEGDDGLFITMPHRRLPNGERGDVAHPLTREFRQQVQERVLSAAVNLLHVQPGWLEYASWHRAGLSDED